MKYWFVIATILIVCNVSAQNISDLNDKKLRVQLQGGIGKSFMGSISYGVGGEFLYRLNQLGYRYNYDSENYTHLQAEGTWSYGDPGYLREMASNNFYYGRSIQDDILVGTAKIGLSQLTFKDASYTSDSVAGNWLMPPSIAYTVSYHTKHAMGVLLETEGTIYFWRYFGTGIRVYANFNKLRNFGGFQVYMSFFIGPK